MSTETLFAEIKVEITDTESIFAELTIELGLSLPSISLEVA
jgi:hypothetical protein